MLLIVISCIIFNLCTSYANTHTHVGKHAECTAFQNLPRFFMLMFFSFCACYLKQIGFLHSTSAIQTKKDKNKSKLKSRFSSVCTRLPPSTYAATMPHATCFQKPVKALVCLHVCTQALPYWQRCSHLLLFFS